MKVLMLLVFSAILPCAVAQQSGNSGTGSGNTGTTTTQPSANRTIIVIPTENQSTAQQQKLPELIFISGEVITEDGMPAPFGSVVERECGGAVIKEAVVDSGGRFSFQIGDQNRFGRIFPDASQAINQDPIDRDSPLINPNIPEEIANKLTAPLFTKLVGCEVRAQLSGYRSTVVRLGGGPRTGIIDVGTIVLYPLSRARGTTVSATNLLAPKTAKKALENARKASKKKNLMKRKNG